MKRLTLSTVLALCLAVPAFADNNSGPNCNGNGSCGSTTNNTTTISNAPVANGGSGGVAFGGAGGQGGKGGDAAAAAIANSSSKSSAAAVGVNSNDNRSSARQDQDQAQLQAQEQGQSVTYINPRAPVSTASAAALATSSEACMGSTTIGGQGVSFGLSFGTTWENEDCTLRKRAGLLYAVGSPDAAKELLCSNGAIRAAYLAAGKPCAADKPAAVPVAQVPAKPSVEIVGMSTPVPN